MSDILALESIILNRSWLASSILFSAAVNSAIVAKPDVLDILPSISVILAL